MKKPGTPSHLAFVRPEELRLRRVRKGKNFSYLDLKNRPVKDAKVLERIKKMALPPAWEDVRISARANAHLQAVGRDVKGRVQYRYHEHYRKHRDQTKFHRLVEFAQHLPLIRKKVNAHLKIKDFTREKVLAGIVGILQQTTMRVGNDIYSRTNHSYGITTVRNKHAKVVGTKVRFHYKGKSGKMRDIQFDDPILSRIVRKCQELPGQELFCYKGEDGKVHDVTSTDVNRYIQEISGQKFTAKDFRTWSGTLRAMELVLTEGEPEKLNDRGWRKRHLSVIRQTAEHLGNTPSICEKYYIHPKVFSADRELTLFSRRPCRRIQGLNRIECEVLNLIKSA